jgi:Fibronectin type III domain
MTTTNKQHPIKAVKNFRRMAAEVVVTTSQATQAHFDPATNPNLTGAPPLPVDIATVKSATDLLSAKIAAAAEGGKTAVADKNRQKEVVVNLLIQLAQYAEANCKDDMTTFLSFGFTPAASTKAKTAPLSESIRKIEPGPNSGEMLITLMKFLGAVSYLMQFAPVVNGVVGSWTSKPVPNIRPPFLVTGLTPGTTYVFQARALTKAGYSDWSESVTRIAV